MQVQNSNTDSFPIDTFAERYAFTKPNAEVAAGVIREAKFALMRLILETSRTLDDDDEAATELREDIASVRDMALDHVFDSNGDPRARIFPHPVETGNAIVDTFDAWQGVFADVEMVRRYLLQALTYAPVSS